MAKEEGEGGGWGVSRDWYISTSYPGCQVQSGSSFHSLNSTDTLLHSLACIAYNKVANNKELRNSVPGTEEPACAKASIRESGSLLGPGSLSPSVWTRQSAQSSRPPPELDLYTKGAEEWEGLQQLGVEVRGGF